MLTRALIVLHRWLGVALCVLFLVWFPSGIAMMYWDFPEVTAEARLTRAAPLNANDIRLLPAQAAAALGLRQEPLRARIETFDGRPLYRLQTVDGDRAIYADTGEPLSAIQPALALRVASSWSRQTAADARVDAIDDVDQWTVQGAVRRLGPFWKYSWPNGEQVYVSRTSGEVVQHTTSASRLGAYLGAIPHWLYFTPLRKHQERWSRVVIYSSAIGTVSAVLGAVVAIVVFSPTRRYRRAGRPTAIPYTGFKRWHMVIGLAAGAGAITWAYSGMLSMDPFAPRPRAPASEQARQALRHALRGPLMLHAFDAKHPREALASLDAHPSVVELELVSIGSEPVYLATAGAGTRFVPLDGRAFDELRVREVVRQAAGAAGIAELRMIDEYDRYYLDRRRRLPLPVLLLRLDDSGSSRYYIDPRTARIAGSYSDADWSSRWLYHGLHSLDFPWLYDHRPAWDIVVIAFMLAGTALSVTSLVLAWRVVARKLWVRGVRLSASANATADPP